MKSLIVLSFLFFFSLESNAQDTLCEKVRTLMNTPHRVARRSITKVSKNDITSMVNMTESDTFSNSYSRTTMNLKMGEMILENMSYGGKKYNKKNGEPWKLQGTLPELQAKLEKARKVQKALPDTQRILDTHYRDCKQLADEMINGIECEVFTFTTDSYQKNEQTNSYDIMKQKSWYSRQGLVQKLEIKTYSSDNIFKDSLITNFEYDPKILIKEPKIKQK